MGKKTVEKPAKTQPEKPGYTPFEDALKRLLRVKKTELDDALEREARAKGRKKKSE